MASNMMVECPVCTLYLRAGMNLEEHLDTHPKEKVIKALVWSMNQSAMLDYGGTFVQDQKSRPMGMAIEEQTAASRAGDHASMSAMDDPNIRLYEAQQATVYVDNSVFSPGEAAHGTSNVAQQIALVETCDVNGIPSIRLSALQNSVTIVKPEVLTQSPLMRQSVQTSTPLLPAGHMLTAAGTSLQPESSTIVPVSHEYIEPVNVSTTVGGRPTGTVGCQPGSSTVYPRYTNELYSGPPPPYSRAVSSTVAINTHSTTLQQQPQGSCSSEKLSMTNSTPNAPSTIVNLRPGCLPQHMQLSAHTTATLLPPPPPPPPPPASANSPTNIAFPSAGSAPPNKSVVERAQDEPIVPSPANMEPGQESLLTGQRSHVTRSLTPSASSSLKSSANAGSRSGELQEEPRLAATVAPKTNVVKVLSDVKVLHSVNLNEVGFQKFLQHLKVGKMTIVGDKNTLISGSSTTRPSAFAETNENGMPLSMIQSEDDTAVVQEVSSEGEFVNAYEQDDLNHDDSVEEQEVEQQDRYVDTKWYDVPTVKRIRIPPGAKSHSEPEEKATVKASTIPPSVAGNNAMMTSVIQMTPQPKCPDQQPLASEQRSQPCVRRLFHNNNSFTPPTINGSSDTTTAALSPEEPDVKNVLCPLVEDVQSETHLVQQVDPLIGSLPTNCIAEPMETELPVPKVVNNKAFGSSTGLSDGASTSGAVIVPVQSSSTAARRVEYLALQKKCIRQPKKLAVKLKRPLEGVSPTVMIADKPTQKTTSMTNPSTAMPLATPATEQHESLSSGLSAVIQKTEGGCGTMNPPANSSVDQQQYLKVQIKEERAPPTAKCGMGVYDTERSAASPLRTPTSIALVPPPGARSTGDRQSEIDVGAYRISYVGEAGQTLYHPLPKNENIPLPSVKKLNDEHKEDMPEVDKSKEEPVDGQRDEPTEQELEEMELEDEEEDEEEDDDEEDDDDEPEEDDIDVEDVDDDMEEDDDEEDEEVEDDGVNGAMRRVASTSRRRLLIQQQKTRPRLGEMLAGSDVIKQGRRDTRGRHGTGYSPKSLELTSSDEDEDDNEDEHQAAGESALLRPDDTVDGPKPAVKQECPSMVLPLYATVTGESHRECSHSPTPPCVEKDLLEAGPSSRSYSSQQRERTSPPRPRIRVASESSFRSNKRQCNAADDEQMLIYNEQKHYPLMEGSGSSNSIGSHMSNHGCTFNGNVSHDTQSSHSIRKDFLEAGPSSQSNCGLSEGYLSGRQHHSATEQQATVTSVTLPKRENDSGGEQSPLKPTMMQLSWSLVKSVGNTESTAAAVAAVLSSTTVTIGKTEPFEEDEQNHEDEDTLLSSVSFMDLGHRKAENTCGSNGNSGGNAPVGNGGVLGDIPNSNMSSSISSITSYSMERAPSTESLNIRTDEKMPAKGEISEQESNGDMDVTSWNRLYAVGDNLPNYPSSYDLSTAQECWNLSNHNQSLCALTESSSHLYHHHSAGTNPSHSSPASYMSPRLAFQFSSPSHQQLQQHVQNPTFGSCGMAGKIEPRHDDESESDDARSVDVQTRCLKNAIPNLPYVDMMVAKMHQQQGRSLYDDLGLPQQLQQQQQYTDVGAAGTSYFGVTAGGDSLVPTETNALVMLSSQNKASSSGVTRTYRCSFCIKVFSSVKQRRVHQNSEHADELIALMPSSHRPLPDGDEAEIGGFDGRAEFKKQLTPVVMNYYWMRQEIQRKSEATQKVSSVGEGLMMSTGTTLNCTINIETGEAPSQQLHSLISAVSVPLPEAKLPLLPETAPEHPVLKGVVEEGESVGGLEELMAQVAVRNRAYVCATCNMMFQRFNVFNEHLLVHPVECLACGRHFKQWRNFSLHIKRHLGIKEHQCRTCGKRFVIKQKLIEHMRVHTGLAPIKCKLCNRTFKRFSNLAQHRKRYHLNRVVQKEDYVCQQCGEVFHSVAKMAWHKETHEKRPKPCPYCREKFIHRNSLTRHIRLSHTDKYATLENKTEPCTICQQPYTKTSMRRHMETHTKERMAYACGICNKRFSTNWNLKQHKWTHANPTMKPFQCTFCTSAFVRESDFVTHVNAHRSIRPYTCNHCGRQFIRKYNWIRHTREHEVDKGHRCDVCGRQFHRKYYLTEHKRIHTGERPFSCNICGKTSATKTNHNKHVRIHHARDPLTAEG